ncbi:MAG: NAD(P)/FAD-dependent oxidoreductase [Deltaproteobacteria bacterium]|nr:NAD(P)/FAD-dependent oxidoreductase [Deltaproteobacteria bacterium]
MKRLFRGLRDHPPRTSYDAVVVGSGVGGLVAANILARDGLSVLLVEQHYMVGGYCSTFRRAGFTFDASTHFYPLLGNPSTLPGKLLADLGMTTRWVKMDPVDAFHFPDGSRFDVPADFEPYRARLDAEFPEEKEALDRFFEEVREAYLLGLLCYFRNRPTERLGEYRDLTVRQALDRRFKSEKLKLLLTADCPHWGSPPNRTSFVFDSMLRLSYFLGNYYPEGGSQAFADELARCFESHGGEILMSSTVERILMANGSACGVEIETTRGPLKGRRRVSAGAVISNADLTTTWERLLGPGHLPPEFQGELREMKKMRPSFPCFLSHIGLKDVDPEVLERAQGYYWAHWDPDRVGRDGLICKIFVPTLFEPKLAPSGGQIVILQKVQEMNYDEIEDWPGHKAQVEAFVTDQLERVIPGIRRKIIVQTSASAATAHRFTGNTAGSMLGWEMSPEQLGEARPGVVGPVPGLFQVGHWVRPGGGITPVIISAMQVAEAVTGSWQPSLENAVGMNTGPLPPGRR